MPMNAVLLVVFLIGAPLVMMVRLLLQHQLTLELREQGLHARGREGCGPMTNRLRARSGSPGR